MEHRAWLGNEITTNSLQTITAVNDFLPLILSYARTAGTGEPPQRLRAALDNDPRCLYLSALCTVRLKEV